MHKIRSLPRRAVSAVIAFLLLLGLAVIAAAPAEAGRSALIRPGPAPGHATSGKGVAKFSRPTQSAPGRLRLSLRYGGNANDVGSTATVRITVTK